MIWSVAVYVRPSWLVYRSWQLPLTIGPLSRPLTCRKSLLLHPHLSWETWMLQRALADTKLKRAEVRGERARAPRSMCVNETIFATFVPRILSSTRWIVYLENDSGWMWWRVRGEKIQVLRSCEPPLYTVTPARQFRSALNKFKDAKDLTY